MQKESKGKGLDPYQAIPTRKKGPSIKNLLLFTGVLIVTLLTLLQFGLPPSDTLRTRWSQFGHSLTSLLEKLPFNQPEDITQSVCHGHGTKNLNGDCVCDLGYQGLDCLESLPFINIAKGKTPSICVVVTSLGQLQATWDDSSDANQAWVQNLADQGYNTTVLYAGPDDGDVESFIQKRAKSNYKVIKLPSLYLKYDKTMTPVTQASYEIRHFLESQPSPFDVVHFAQNPALGYHTLLAQSQGLTYSHTRFWVTLDRPLSQLDMSNAITTSSSLKENSMMQKVVTMADKVTSLGLTQVEQEITQLRLTLKAPLIKFSSFPVNEELPKRQQAITTVNELVVFWSSNTIPEERENIYAALDRANVFLNQQKVAVTFLGDTDSKALETRGKKWLFSWTSKPEMPFVKGMEFMTKGNRLAMIPQSSERPSTVFKYFAEAKIPFITPLFGNLLELFQSNSTIPLTPKNPIQLAKVIESMIQNPKVPEVNSNSVTGSMQWNSQLEDLRIMKKSVSPPTSQEDASPLVSVVIALRHSKEIVNRLLGSLQSQTYNNTEIVIVNTDKGVEENGKLMGGFILSSWEKKGIKVLRDPAPDQAMARNLGAKQASGNYVLFLPDNAIAKPHLIQTLVRVAQHSNAEVVSSGFDVIGKDETTGKAKLTPERFLPLGNEIPLGFLDSMIHAKGFIASRSYFLEMGGYGETKEVKYIEDYDFLSKVVLQHHRIQIVSEPLLLAPRTSHIALRQENAGRSQMRLLGTFIELHPELKPRGAELESNLNKLFARGDEDNLSEPITTTLLVSSSSSLSLSKKVTSRAASSREGVLNTFMWEPLTIFTIPPLSSITLTMSSSSLSSLGINTTSVSFSPGVSTWTAIPTSASDTTSLWDTETSSTWTASTSSAEETESTTTEEDVTTTTEAYTSFPTTVSSATSTAEQTTVSTSTVEETTLGTTTDVVTTTVTTTTEEEETTTPTTQTTPSVASSAATTTLTTSTEATTSLSTSTESAVTPTATSSGLTQVTTTTFITTTQVAPSTSSSMAISIPASSTTTQTSSSTSVPTTTSLTSVIKSTTLPKSSTITTTSSAPPSTTTSSSSPSITATTLITTSIATLPSTSSKIPVSTSTTTTTIATTTTKQASTSAPTTTSSSTSSVVSSKTTTKSTSTQVPGRTTFMVEVFTRLYSLTIVSTSEPPLSTSTTATSTTIPVATTTTAATAQSVGPTTTVTLSTSIQSTTTETTSTVESSASYPTTTSPAVTTTQVESSSTTTIQPPPSTDTDTTEPTSATSTTTSFTGISTTSQSLGDITGTSSAFPISTTTITSSTETTEPTLTESTTTAFPGISTTTQSLGDITGTSSAFPIATTPISSSTGTTEPTLTASTKSAFPSISTTTQSLGDISGTGSVTPFSTTTISSSTVTTESTLTSSTTTAFPVISMTTQSLGDITGTSSAFPISTTTISSTTQSEEATSTTQATDSSSLPFITTTSTLVTSPTTLESQTTALTTLESSTLVSLSSTLTSSITVSTSSSTTTMTTTQTRVETTSVGTITTISTSTLELTGASTTTSRVSSTTSLASTPTSIVTTTSTLSTTSASTEIRTSTSTSSQTTVSTAVASSTLLSSTTSVTTVVTAPTSTLVKTTSLSISPGTTEATTTTATQTTAVTPTIILTSTPGTTSATVISVTPVATTSRTTTLATTPATTGKESATTSSSTFVPTTTVSITTETHPETETTTTLSTVMTTTPSASTKSTTASSKTEASTSSFITTSATTVAATTTTLITSTAGSSVVTTSSTSASKGTATSPVETTTMATTTSMVTSTQIVTTTSMSVTSTTSAATSSSAPAYLTFMYEPLTQLYMEVISTSTTTTSSLQTSSSSPTTTVMTTSGSATIVTLTSSKMTSTEIATTETSATPAISTSVTTPSQSASDTSMTSSTTVQTVTTPLETSTTQVTLASSTSFTTSSQSSSETSMASSTTAATTPLETSTAQVTSASSTSFTTPSQSSSESSMTSSTTVPTLTTLWETSTTQVTPAASTAITTSSSEPPKTSSSAIQVSTKPSESSTLQTSTTVLTTSTMSTSIVVTQTSVIPLTTSKTISTITSSTTSTGDIKTTLTSLTRVTTTTSSSITGVTTTSSSLTGVTTSKTKTVHPTTSKIKVYPTFLLEPFTSSYYLDQGTTTPPVIPTTTTTFIALPTTTTSTLATTTTTTTTTTSKISSSSTTTTTTATTSPTSSETTCSDPSKKYYAECNGCFLFNPMDCAGSCTNEHVVDCSGSCVLRSEQKHRDCSGQCLYTKDPQFRELDACGVCNGGNVSCTDCMHVLFGTAKLDNCGVCQGNNTSCFTVVRLYPDVQRQVDGATITLYGAGFPATDVLINQVSVKGNILSSTTSTMTILLPNISLGEQLYVTSQVSVVGVNKTTNQPVTFDFSFILYSPDTQLDSISPSKVYVNQETLIRLTGNNLFSYPEAYCVFGDSQLGYSTSRFTYVSSTSGTCQSPIQSVSRNAGLDVNLIYGNDFATSYFVPTSSQGDRLLKYYETAPSLLPQANFSSNGAFIYLYFDKGVSLAADPNQDLTVSNNCQKFLQVDSTGSKVLWNDSSQCSATFLNPSTMQVSIDSRFIRDNIALIPSIGDAISLAPNTLGSRFAYYSDTATGSAIINAPSNAIAPTVSVLAPTRLDSCPDLTMDLSGTSGGGGRPFINGDFSSTMVSTSGASATPAAVNQILKSALELILTNTDTSINPFVITIGKSNLGDGYYTFTFVLTNFLGQSGSTTFNVVKNSNAHIPYILFTPPSSFQPNILNSLSLDVSYPCGTEFGLVENRWESLNSSVSITGANAVRRVVNFPPYSLVAGKTYEFQVDTWYANYPEEVYSYTAQVPITPGVLSLDIGISYTIGTTGTLRIQSQLSDSGYSVANVNNNPQRYSIQWSCIQNEDNCYDAEGNVISLPNGPTLTMNSLLPAGSYVISAFVINTDTLATAVSTPASVTVIDGIVPFISIFATDKKPSAWSNFVINSQISGYVSDKKNLIITWESLSSCDGVDYSTIDLTNPSNILSMGRSLKFAPGVLSSGSSYCFKATLKDPKLANTGSSTAIISIRDRPSTGYCNIVGINEGVEFSSQFSFQCSQWLTDAESYPLFYGWEMKRSEDVSWTMIYAPDVAPTFTTFLPQGNYNLRVTVVDQVGAQNAEEQIMQVTVNANSDPNAKQAFASNAQNSFAQTGNAKQAMQNMALISSPSSTTTKKKRQQASSNSLALSTLNFLQSLLDGGNVVLDPQGTGPQMVSMINNLAGTTADLSPLMQGTLYNLLASNIEQLSNNTQVTQDCYSTADAQSIFAILDVLLASAASGVANDTLVSGITATIETLETCMLRTQSCGQNMNVVTSTLNRTLGVVDTSIPQSLCDGAFQLSNLATLMGSNVDQYGFIRYRCGITHSQSLFQNNGTIGNIVNDITFHDSNANVVSVQNSTDPILITIPLEAAFASKFGLVGYVIGEDNDFSLHPYVPQCTYYDGIIGNAGNWSLEGCTPVSMTNTALTCNCSHLTTFGANVIAAIQPVTTNEAPGPSSSTPTSSQETSSSSSNGTVIAASTAGVVVAAVLAVTGARRRQQKAKGTKVSPQKDTKKALVLPPGVLQGIEDVESKTKDKEESLKSRPKSDSKSFKSIASEEEKKEQDIISPGLDIEQVEEEEEEEKSSSAEEGNEQADKKSQTVSSKRAKRSSVSRTPQRVSTPEHIVRTLAHLPAYSLPPSYEEHMRSKGIDINAERPIKKASLADRVTEVSIENLDLSFDSIETIEGKGQGVERS